MSIATKRVGLMAFVLVFGLGGTARADLLYVTGAPDPYLIGSQEMTTNIVAANFGFGAAATITDITFDDWEQKGSPGYTGTITWTIYQDNGGVVGATLVSGTTSNVSRSGGGSTPLFPTFAEYQNDIPVSIALGPGYYWLGLHNGPLSHDSNDSMFWAKSIVTPALYFPQTYDLTAGGPWVSRSVDAPVFELIGQQGVAVPEPSTLMAVGAGGLLWLGYAARRRAARA